MQFLITARDATDAQAPARRLEHRAAHLDTIARYKASGNMRIGAALLDEQGQMCGSVIIADFPDRASMEAWLNNDPYATGKVWVEVQVQECRVAPSFL